MLSVTEAAATAIENMSQRHGVSHEGGLRVDVGPSAMEGEFFALSLVSAPSNGDQIVVARPGVNVFIRPQASTHMTDKILDVLEDNGDVKFRLLRR